MYIRAYGIEHKADGIRDENMRCIYTYARRDFKGRDIYVFVKLLKEKMGEYSFMSELLFSF
jgi:hypothetical protein